MNLVKFTLLIVLTLNAADARAQTIDKSQYLMNLFCGVSKNMSRYEIRLLLQSEKQFRKMKEGLDPYDSSSYIIDAEITHYDANDELNSACDKHIYFTFGSDSDSIQMMSISYYFGSSNAKRYTQVRNEIIQNANKLFRYSQTKSLTNGKLVYGQEFSAYSKPISMKSHPNIHLINRYLTCGKLKDCICGQNDRLENRINPESDGYSIMVFYYFN